MKLHVASNSVVENQRNESSVCEIFSPNGPKRNVSSRYLTMKSTCLLILASVMACNLTVSRGQSIPAEDELEPGTLDDILLERAESLLLRSILKKMRDEDATNSEYRRFYGCKAGPCHCRVLCVL